MQKQYLGSQNGLRRQKKYNDIPKTIGIIPKLAPGAINPMWSIQAGLEPFLKQNKEVLAYPKDKKRKKAIQNKHGFGIIEVYAIDEEEKTL